MSATWGLIIDVARCHDCNNCFLACKDEFVGNDWPPYTQAQPDHGQRWMNIHRKEQGQYPLVEVAYLPKPCQHCQNPPCLKAARNGAVTIRADGIVMLHGEKARGQQELVKACPYGAIFWNETSQTAQKCSLCAHLLDEGWQEPRCVQACPTGALLAHKLTSEEWRQRIADEDLSVYLPKSGCQPRVHYKNLKQFTHGFIAGTVAIAQTDECAENAQVLLKGEDGQIIAQTRTDNYGDFKLMGLEENTSGLRVEITAPGGLQSKSVAVAFSTSINLGTIII